MNLPTDVAKLLRPSRWRRTLGLGPSRGQLYAAIEHLAEGRGRGRAATEAAELRAVGLRLERGQLRQQLDDLRGEAKRERAALRRQVDDLRNLVNNRLNEPPPVEGCDKVRWHTRTEAEDWAVRLAESLGEPVGVYRAYACQQCPRHPGTLSKFWHVGHKANDGRAQRSKADQRERHLRQSALAVRSGTTLGARIDPTVIARITGGEQ